jgi:hypothetical protein|tara:strand:+ start:15588 stop:16262 length:675 start_codon:yes stop_codon:yes gene_type:complete
MCSFDEQKAEALVYILGVGEDEDNDWVCIDARIDDGETEDEDFEGMLNASLNVALASTGSANRNAKSRQDNNFVKVRYAYVQGSKKHGSSLAKKGRPFCMAMEGANKLYRKEDIIKMKSQGLNRTLGHKGQSYSIWLHKGGVNCYHKFERRIYIKRKKNDGKAWGGGAFNGVKKSTIAQARKYHFNPKSGRFKNDRRVAEAQIDRADKGHHPSWRPSNKSKKRR